MTMNDQLKSLRQAKMNEGSASVQEKKTRLKTFAITSGKGGVGKTNICLNLGIALAHRGKKVIVMDTDLTLGNLDVLLGLSPQFTLRNVIAGQKRMSEILVDAVGVKILPASSGALELVNIDTQTRKMLAQEFQRLSDDFDYLLIDTPAGLGPHVYDFLDIADYVMVVTTTEPPAIIDAYAMIKLLRNRNPEIVIDVTINLVKSKEQAQEVVKKLNIVLQQYLTMQIENWNFILFDSSIPKAVQQQKPFIIYSKDCKASQCIAVIADRLLMRNQDLDRKKEPFHIKFVKKNARTLGATLDKLL